MRMRPEILIAIRVRNWKLPILRGRQFPSGALTVDILTATDTNRGDQVAISSSYLVCFQPLTWPKWKVSKWKSAHWTRGLFRLPATRAGDRQGQLSVTWFDGPVDDIQPLFFRVQLMDIKSEDGSRHIPLGRMRLIVAGHFLGRWGAFPAFPPPIAGSDAHDWAFLKNWPTCKQHPRWTGTECFHILKVQSSVEVKLRKKNFFKPKPLPFTAIFFKKRGNYSPDLNQSIAIQTPHTFWLQDDWTRKIDAFFSLISSWTIGLITLSSKDVEKIFSTAIEWYPRLSKSLENKQVIRWVWKGWKINLWLLS